MACIKVNASNSRCGQFLSLVVLPILLNRCHPEVRNVVIGWIVIPVIDLFTLLQHVTFKNPNKVMK